MHATSTISKPYKNIIELELG